MLAGADRALVEREPAMPGLTALLDEGALGATWARALDAEGATRAVYARYKPGGHCLVAYESKAPGGTRRAHGVAFHESQRAKFEKASAERGLDAGRGDASRLLMVYEYPADRRLPAAWRLGDPAARAGLVARAAPGINADDGPVVLAYKPERRLVARVGSGAESAVIKCHGESDWDAVARVTGALRERPGPWPRVLGASERHRAVGWEWLEGVAGRAGAEDGGAALALLHRVTPPSSLGPVGPGEVARRAAGSAAGIGSVMPDLGGRAERLRSLIVDRWAPGGALLHGDAGPSQLVREGRGWRWIDLDGAGIGHPALDVGAYAARVEEREGRGRLLLDAYRAGGGQLDEGAFEVGFALGLLEGVIEPFRRREPGWDAKISSRLRRAEEALRGG